MAAKKSKEKKSFIEEIEIPPNINASVNKHNIKLAKDGVEIERKLNPAIETKMEKNKLILSARKSTKRERKSLGSDISHIRNMIEGLTKGFKYKLRVGNVHFPITIEHDKTNNILLIKNFLGEKTPRTAKILNGVQVKINKDLIELESPDIEKAGQTAANIEKATKIRFRDRRVFQDGIYITEKPGRQYS